MLFINLQQEFAGMIMEICSTNIPYDNTYYPIDFSIELLFTYFFCNFINILFIYCISGCYCCCFGAPFVLSKCVHKFYDINKHHNSAQSRARVPFGFRRHRNALNLQTIFISSRCTLYYGWIYNYIRSKAFSLSVRVETQLKMIITKKSEITAEPTK